MYLVLARYREDISWLFKILYRFPEWQAFVYNDGSALEIPVDLQDRLKVLPGDGCATEGTKYLQYIIDNWDNFNPEQRVTFLQADPHYHSPDIEELFYHVDDWNPIYQNLTLYGHPPPWEPAQAILNSTAPNITTFGTGNQARTWCDTMDDDFQGIYWRDPWMDEFNKIERVTVRELCSLFHVEPPEVMKKTYSALFSIKWSTIKKHNIHTWIDVQKFIYNGNERVQRFNPRERGVYIEYMWSVICEGSPL